MRIYFEGEQLTENESGEQVPHYVLQIFISPEEKDTLRAEELGALILEVIDGS
jgi:hypothetical protein